MWSNRDMETRELTGAEAIVEGLLAHDIDTVFALPGVQIYGLIDALAKNRDRIRTIGARHEQASAYMAFGYARASGKPGVFAVVPGPGILNASAALLTADSCNARVLGLTGAHRGQSATRLGWRPLAVHSPHFQLTAT